MIHTNRSLQEDPQDGQACGFPDGATLSKPVIDIQSFKFLISEALSNLEALGLNERIDQEEYSVRLELFVNSEAFKALSRGLIEVSEQIAAKVDGLHPIHRQVEGAELLADLHYQAIILANDQLQDPVSLDAFRSAARAVENAP